MFPNQQTTSFLVRISAKVVDGTIVAMAVLGSLSYSVPNNLVVIVTVVASLLAIVLSHTYGEMINELIKHRRVAQWRHLRPITAKRAWMLSSTLVPILFFGLAIFGVIGENEAFLLTEIVVIFVLFLFGFLARRLSGGGIIRAASFGALAVILGLILEEIKRWAKYLPL